MLKELYDYAVRNDLMIPPGFVKKTVRYYICISEKAEFITLLDGDTEEIPCPDIGSLANGTDKCNLLVEKASVILSETDTPKRRFFRESMKQSGVPALMRCIEALENETTFAAILAEAQRAKVKPTDRISFYIKDKPILKAEGLTEWWTAFRMQFEKPEKTEERCLMTGNRTSPPATLPKINGLRVVGGHSSGDALICFDKAAFCSYGLKQGENAPVSEEAYTGVKAALDDLLTDAPILAGMKFVHWYDREIPREDDICVGVFGGRDSDGEDENTEASVQAYVTEAISVNEAARRETADRIPKSIRSGESAPELDAVYHILLLSGVGGRVMVRRYERGCYEDLQRNLTKWYEDISLCDNLGTGTVRNYKLSARLIRLMKRQEHDTKILDRMSKELAGITPSVISAIMNGSRLPDSVAERALAYIRADMLSGNEDTDKKSKNASSMPDAIACQWLKAWLIRNAQEKGEETYLMEKYNPKHPRTEYHCGALVALFEKIQAVASGGVNAGVVQRYYASASRTPSLVIGRLATLSNFHLSQMDDKLKYVYSVRLNDLFSALGDTLPKVLDLEGQSYFALGYRQYAAQMEAERLLASAEKKERESQNKTTAADNAADTEITEG